MGLLKKGPEVPVLYKYVCIVQFKQDPAKFSSSCQCDGEQAIIRENIQTFKSSNVKKQ